MGAGRGTIAWLVLLALHAGTAIADDAADPALDRCPPDTRDRLRFLEHHLDDEQTYAERWWIGWTTVYSAGIVVEGGLAAKTDDGGKRADHVVGAVKSGVGLAEGLLRQPPAKEGTRDLGEMPTSTPEGCAQRLARAEQILRENAARSRRERRSWIPHAGNLALNLAGAVIVAKAFDESSGWASGALGFAVGEARIWSYPWQARGALTEYERRFPASGVPRPPDTTWRLEPWGAGAQVVVRY